MRKNIDTLLVEFFDEHPRAELYIRRDRAFHRFEVGLKDGSGQHEHVDKLEDGVRMMWMVAR
jgi:hypothetical protein